MSNDLLIQMDRLEGRFTEWARRRRDVRAAIVVGSRARVDRPADEWADLDVAIMTTRPSLYHSGTAWLADISPVWTYYRDPSGVTYHALFEGGLDAGIAIISEQSLRLATRVAPAIQRLPFSFGIRRRLEREIKGASEYYRRGVRILFDKDDTARKFLAMAPASTETAAPPSLAEFEAVTNEFWFVAAWTAKHLWRGELWRARSTGTEGSLPRCLLQLIEWYARAAHGAAYDTWREGQFLENWADPNVVGRLGGAFAGYDRSAQEAALNSMMETFAWLSEETARSYGLPYSPSPAEAVRRWIGANTPDH